MFSLSLMQTIAELVAVLRATPTVAASEQRIVTALYERHVGETMTTREVLGCLQFLLGKERLRRLVRGESHARV